MTATMAKPKKSRPAPRPEDADRKPMILQMRGSAEFKAWCEGLADMDRSSLALLAEKALIFYGKQIGYSPTPPRR
jgi:hypothetical protein